MKNISTIFIVLLSLGLAFSPVTVQAAPFLVCDAEPNVDSCVVEVNGVEFPTPYPLHYDLAGINMGAHTVRAKFVNALWGDTAWSDPLDFTRPSLGVPSGLGLSAD